MKMRFSPLTAWQLASLLVAAPVGAADLTPAPPSLTPRAQSLACAPRTVDVAAPAARIRGGRDRNTKGIFAPGEVVVLDTSGGATVAAGELYVVYRRPRSAVWAADSQWVRRAAQNVGLVRVDAVTGAIASASVVWACDGVETGDVLEPYVAPSTMPEAQAAAGPATFDQASEVLFGGQDRRLGAARDFLLVARPAGVDVAVGQRVTFFRRLYGVDGPVSVLGDGIVHAVSHGTYLVEVASSRDAIVAGDLVATHRPGAL